MTLPQMSLKYQFAKKQIKVAIRWEKAFQKSLVSRSGTANDFNKGCKMNLQIFKQFQFFS